MVEKPSSSWTTARIYIATTAVLLVAVVLGGTQLVPREAAISIGVAAVLVHMSVSLSMPCNATSGAGPVMDEDDTGIRADCENPSKPKTRRR